MASHTPSRSGPIGCRDLDPREVLVWHLSSCRKQSISDTRTENPIWTFAKKWNLNNTYSNYSNILTYNETGYADFSSLLDEFEDIYDSAAEQAGIILKENLQDQTARMGLSLAGWKPKRDDMAAQAVEWWEWGECCTISLDRIWLNIAQTGKMRTLPRKAPLYSEQPGIT